MFTEEVATFSAVIGRDTSFSPGQTFLFTNVEVNTNNMYNPSNSGNPFRWQLCDHVVCIDQ
jgi:hypothetical protein